MDRRRAYVDPDPILVLYRAEWHDKGTESLHVEGNINIKITTPKTGKATLQRWARHTDTARGRSRIVPGRVVFPASLGSMLCCDGSRVETIEMVASSESFPQGFDSSNCVPPARSERRPLSHAVGGAQIRRRYAEARGAPRNFSSWGARLGTTFVRVLRGRLRALQTQRTGSAGSGPRKIGGEMHAFIFSPWARGRRPWTWSLSRESGA